jgi:hypothetical protein
MTESTSTSCLTLIELLKKYNPDTFPVSNYNLDSLDEETQDASLNEDNIIHNTLGEETLDTRTNIRNIIDCPISFNRKKSYFSCFLDGCRKAYYLCDMSTPSGAMIPIIAGQVSSAVLKRERSTGKVSLHRYEKLGLLLLPVGGNALNTDDVNVIKKIIDTNFENDGITAKSITIRHPENPKNDALAHLNMEMQGLEIQFLENLAISGEIDQENMIIVDGALQFQRIGKDQQSNLRYAVGLSKHFNLHLRNVISKDREIGTLLINLKDVGDRTVGFRLRMENGAEYAFWYLRIRPREYLNFPFAGIVKLEKILITDKEKEDGLPTDMIDNISRCILLERTVCPYGLDFRWASHIYPIYLTEQIQKKKFTSDYVYRYLLRRKVNI